MTPGDAFLVNLNDGQRLLQTVMSDVTPELLAWAPPGGAHPIGSIYAHAVGLEDLYIQQFIRGEPLLWQTGAWQPRLGHDLPPNQWNLHDLLPRDMPVFEAYRTAVFENSSAYVRSLGADDFDRAIPFPGRSWSMTVAQLLATVITHTASHAGEIAILKGLQGGTGLPY